MPETLAPVSRFRIPPLRSLSDEELDQDLVRSLDEATDLLAEVRRRAAERSPVSEYAITSRPDPVWEFTPCDSQ